YPGAPPRPPSETGAQVMTRSEERDLATRAVTDADAYADIYTRCYPALLTCARRLLRNSEDAEDLVQELFVHIRPKIGQFAGDAALTSWLTRSMFNLHIGSVRLAAVRAERMRVEYAPCQRTAQRPNQSVIVPIVADVIRSL